MPAASTLPPVNIVVALRCEAAPLISHYRLHGENRHRPFRVYSRGQLRLILAGVGKLNAAAAAAYLHGLDDGDRTRAWLNVGIAGHARLAVGEGAVAHKVIDRASGACWYPARIAPRTPSLALTTVDEVVLLHRGETLFDMEAAGFCAAVSRFASCELMQCYKVVSDNRAEPPEYVSEDGVRDLIGGHLDGIGDLLATLSELSAGIAEAERPPEGYDRIVKRWRFTDHQRRRLRRLLQRRRALDADGDAPDRELAGLRTAEEVLAHLSRRIDACTAAAD